MENTTLEIQKDFSKVIRGLIGVVKQQGELLERLHHAHMALLEVLSGGAAPSTGPAIDLKAAERRRDEIAELYRLFGEEAED